MVKEIDIQVLEIQSPNKLDPKRITSRHEIINMPMVTHKENLKSSKKKQRVTYKGVPIRLSADFSISLFKVNTLTPQLVVMFYRGAQGWNARSFRIRLGS